MELGRQAPSESKHLAFGPPKNVEDVRWSTTGIV